MFTRTGSTMVYPRFGTSIAIDLMYFHVHASFQTKGKQAAAPKMDTYLPQVSTLSDEELAAQLQGYGEIIGPITATTRIVYERQLAKLMATEG